VKYVNNGFFVVLQEHWPLGAQHLNSTTSISLPLLRNVQVKVLSLKCNFGKTVRVIFSQPKFCRNFLLKFFTKMKKQIELPAISGIPITLITIFNDEGEEDISQCHLEKI
jgi:hypothetical protein